jgi:hypothetical protein
MTRCRALANPRTIYRSTARITPRRAACHASFHQGCFPRRFAAPSMRKGNSPGFVEIGFLRRFAAAPLKLPGVGSPVDDCCSKATGISPYHVCPEAGEMGGALPRSHRRWLSRAAGPFGRERAGRGHHLSLIRTRTDWTGPTELRISITPLSLLCSFARTIRRPCFVSLSRTFAVPSGDVCGAGSKPDAIRHLGRTVIVQPQGTGTHEDDYARLARLDRALYRIALDEDAASGPGAPELRVRLGRGSFGRQRQ